MSRTSWREVPIPDRMKHLKLDKRGFPIPCMVSIGNDGTPYFAMNDESVRQGVIYGDLCSICGTGLLRGRFFAGGPQSAFHAQGAYIDPPMHRECVTYAMMVCPYLAARSYSGLHGEAKVDAAVEAGKNIPGIVKMVDPTMIPERPETFVVVMSSATRIARYFEGTRMVQYLRPKKPYMSVEYWRGGVQIEEPPTGFLK